MRIIDMRPERTAWSEDQTKKASSWKMRDALVFDWEEQCDMAVRYIYHYSTLMGTFYQRRYNGWLDHNRSESSVFYGDWHFKPVSIGHGSVSDQGGMNQLMSVKYVWNDGLTVDYGYRYHRDQRGGGPRIVNTTWPGQDAVVGG